MIQKNDLIAEIQITNFMLKPKNKQRKLIETKYKI